MLTIRGPPIGPLVIAGVLISEDKHDKLKKLGVKDSKLLKPLERERLFPKIIKLADKYKIFIIQPKEIDEALESETSNLNWLEADYMLKIVHDLKPNKAFLDSPSINLVKFSEYLNERLKIKTELIVEHKVDVNYPVASAASILAKVTRDAEIEKIKKEVGVNFGSGYGSDPRTANFIREYHEKYPKLFRKTWASYKVIIDEKKQKKLFDFGLKLPEHPLMQKMKELEKHGFKFVEPKSPYELARMQNEGTVILYTTGKILIQGKEKEKEKIKKLLKN